MFEMVLFGERAIFLHIVIHQMERCVFIFDYCFSSIYMFVFLGSYSLLFQYCSFILCFNFLTFKKYSKII